MSTARQDKPPTQRILLTVPIMNLALIICAIIWRFHSAEKVQRELKFCHSR